MKSLTKSFSPTLIQRRRGLLCILFIGLIIFVWQLGTTGLVDETPPLFAAASRAMAETGNWFTPQVNGLPRFDKPPLVYWLMGLGFSIRGEYFLGPFRDMGCKASFCIINNFFNACFRGHNDEISPRRK